MKVGILGGGQLSRMLALAGIPLGLNFVFYEPRKPCCAEKLGDVIYADYQDVPSLQKFVNQVDVVTYENENIPLRTLEWLGQHKSLYPNAKALCQSRDRLLEKQLFRELNIPTNLFVEVNNQEQLHRAAEQLGYPLILKQRTHGYDGKGQIKINNVTELAKVRDQAKSLVNLLAEQYVPFSREISMVAVGNTVGEHKFYDVCENQHRNGILICTRNRPNDSYFAIACDYVSRILNKFNYVGVMALEFFQVENQLIANEMAPRVHNSGHWTIEGAISSQFENHLRAIVKWPLGSTASLGYATMYNIIGAMPDKIKLLAELGLHLHDYQKQPENGRKLGHVTAMAANLQLSDSRLNDILDTNQVKDFFL